MNEVKNDESQCSDLLCVLLRSLFNRNYPPDELSVEWDFDDNQVIRLQWYTGHVREYAYTYRRFNKAFDLFNQLWKKKLNT